MPDLSIELREQKKYEAVWAIPRYREASPGERAAPVAHKILGMAPGESLTDFGCGTGRATLWFEYMGLRVLGVDITQSALDAEARHLPFLQGPLWNTDIAQMLPLTDWAYCADLMEHIPPEYVVTVLQVIRKATALGAFFNISNGDDCFGPMIGDELHPTKLEHGQWRRLLKQVGFAITSTIEGDRPFTQRYFCEVN